jgi:transcriptional regulator with XRE-family HTH domain
MAVERISVTPSVITWARKRAGLSLEEAKNFGRIDQWESGASSPTYAQLEALASALKVPVSVFFFPEPPDLPDIAQSFRTLPETEFEHIPSRVRLLVRKAKAFQLNLAELTGERNPAPRQILKDLSLSTNEPIPEAAARVRAYLGLTLEAQQTFKTDDDALKAWREALQSVGIFVFKDAFRNDDYSGFCLYDQTFPIIYVNNSSSKTRQMFTLLHELAHLLFQTSGIDTQSGDYVERLGGDAPQQLVRRDHLVEAKLIKQLPLISLLPPHHRRLSCRLLSRNHCSLGSSSPFRRHRPIADSGSAQLYEFHDHVCRLRPDEFAQAAPS